MRFQAIKNAQSRINTALSIGAPDRNRTCTKSLSYGPEPYASASSATGAYILPYLAQHKYSIAVFNNQALLLKTNKKAPNFFVGCF